MQFPSSAAFALPSFSPQPAPAPQQPPAAPAVPQPAPPHAAPAMPQPAPAMPQPAPAAPPAMPQPVPQPHAAPPRYAPQPGYSPPPPAPGYGGDSEPTYHVTRPRKVRGATVAAMIAAAAAVVAAGFVAVQVIFTGGGGGEPTPPAVTEGPRLAGEPPTDLKLRVDGTAITVTWKDPTDGRVPFIVAGAQAGRQHKAMLNVSPGDTSATINGLNPRLGYCFTVLAVYSTEEFAASGQVCTERSSPTPG